MRLIVIVLVAIAGGLLVVWLNRTDVPEEAEAVSNPQVRPVEDMQMQINEPIGAASSVAGSSEAASAEPATPLRAPPVAAAVHDSVPHASIGEGPGIEAIPADVFDPGSPATVDMLDDTGMEQIPPDQSDPGAPQSIPPANDGTESRPHSQ